MSNNKDATYLGPDCFNCDCDHAPIAGSGRCPCCNVQRVEPTVEYVAGVNAALKALGCEVK
jgi:hypothetical protein